MNDINKRIKYFRRLAGYTQNELARLIGMKGSSYSQAEREGNITCDLLLRVAEVLNVDPEILLLGKKSVKVIIAKAKRKPQPEPEPIEIIKDNPYLIEVSSKEKNMVMIFRGLNQEQKNSVYKFINEIEKT